MKFIILILLFISSCKEKVSQTDSHLTEVSIPVEGELPYFKSPILDPYWPKENFKPNDLRRVSDLKLTSYTNKEVKSDDWLGKYKLLIFFYARCQGVCPMITRNMIEFLPKIKNQKDLQILSITVNPEYDTPEVISKFRSNYKIQNTNWEFLTGSEKLIHNLAREQFGAEIQILDGKTNLNEFVHTENVFLLDKENYLRGVYRAKGTGDLERLFIELETLRKL